MSTTVVEPWRYGVGKRPQKPSRNWPRRKIVCIVIGVLLFVVLTGGIGWGKKCPAPSEYDGCYNTLDFYFLNLVGFRLDFDDGKLVFPHSKYPNLFGDAPGADYGFFRPM